MYHTTSYTTKITKPGLFLSFADKNLPVGSAAEATGTPCFVAKIGGCQEHDGPEYIGPQTLLKNKRYIKNLPIYIYHIICTISVSNKCNSSPRPASVLPHCEMH